MTALLCIVQLVAGDVYAALSNLEAVQQAHLEAERFSDTMAWQPFSAPVAAALCANCALQSDWTGAYAWAGKFLETGDTSLDFHTGLIFWYVAEALLRAGETERAVEEIRRFGELAGDNPRYRISYLRAHETFVRAAEMVQAMAARIDDEGLRIGFLRAEPAQRVLAGIK